MTHTYPHAHSSLHRPFSRTASEPCIALIGTAAGLAPRSESGDSEPPPQVLPLREEGVSLPSIMPLIQSWGSEEPSARAQQQQQQQQLESYASIGADGSAIRSGGGVLPSKPRKHLKPASPPRPLPVPAELQVPPPSPRKAANGPLTEVAGDGGAPCLADGSPVHSGGLGGLGGGGFFPARSSGKGSSPTASSSACNAAMLSGEASGNFAQGHTIFTPRTSSGGVPSSSSLPQPPSAYLVSTQRHQPPGAAPSHHLGQVQPKISDFVAASQAAASVIFASPQSARRSQADLVAEIVAAATEGMALASMSKGGPPLTSSPAARLPVAPAASASSTPSHRPIALAFCGDDGLTAPLPAPFAPSSSHMGSEPPPHSSYRRLFRDCDDGLDGYRGASTAFSASGKPLDGPSAGTGVKSPFRKLFADEADTGVGCGSADSSATAFSGCRRLLYGDTLDGLTAPPPVTQPMSPGGTPQGLEGLEHLTIKTLKLPSAPNSASRAGRAGVAHQGHSSAASSTSGPYGAVLPMNVATLSPRAALAHSPSTRLPQQPMAMSRPVSSLSPPRSAPSPRSALFQELQDIKQQLLVRDQAPKGTSQCHVCIGPCTFLCHRGYNIAPLNPLFFRPL